LGVAIEESPGSENVFTELRNRTLATGGWVTVALTANGSDLSYLQKQVNEGVFEDLHTTLTPDAMIGTRSGLPRMIAGQVCNADWIEEVERRCPMHLRAIRVHGAWEISETERFFDCFAALPPDSVGGHVSTQIPDHDLDICLGLDHGSRPGKQIALLIATWPGKRKRTHVHVLAEYAPETETTPEDDAAGILEMLGRFGLQWRDLSFAAGDRVHLPGRGAQKSNRDLAVWIGKRLGVSSHDLSPQIRTAKVGQGRGAGSVFVRARWLYNAILDDRFRVHPRCRRLIEALKRTQLKDDEYKDPIDALVYGLDRAIFSRDQGEQPRFAFH